MPAPITAIGRPMATPRASRPRYSICEKFLQDLSGPARRPGTKRRYRLVRRNGMACRSLRVMTVRLIMVMAVIAMLSDGEADIGTGQNRKDARLHDSAEDAEHQHRNLNRNRQP